MVVRRLRVLLLCYSAYEYVNTSNALAVLTGTARPRVLAVGYGDFAPVTIGGRITFILYALPAKALCAVLIRRVPSYTFLSLGVSCGVIGVVACTLKKAFRMSRKLRS